MSTTATDNSKINTIQPIEGAKGNIALFYYQGKYPIYKSLDDDMYHLKSVMDAFKASSDIDTKKCCICEWKQLESTKRLIDYLLNHSYHRSKTAIKKQQQNAKMQYLDGWYGCEKLMLDLARWLDEGFHCDIYDMFAMSTERARLNAEIIHKQLTIDELREMLKRQEQNDDLHDRANTVQTHVEPTSPSVTSNTIVPISLTISPAISDQQFVRDWYPTDKVIGIIIKIARNTDCNELGIINFNHFHRIIRAALTKTTRDIDITRGLCVYFGGHMYRLKEEPSDGLYEYVQRRRHHDIRYRLIMRSKNPIEFAQESGYNTETFRSKFLRRNAIATLDQGGEGIKDECNDDVYIVGWKIEDISEIFV